MTVFDIQSKARVYFSRVSVPWEPGMGVRLEAGSLITMAFIKNVPDRRVKVTICCHKLCIYFSLPYCLVYICYTLFFHLWHCKYTFRPPTFLTFCAIVKIVHFLMERSQAYWRVCVCVCVFACIRSHTSCSRTLLNFMPSSQFHALLCSSLNVYCQTFAFFSQAQTLFIYWYLPCE